MHVPVVNVGVVRVTMHQPGVNVYMSVRFPRRIARTVGMLVMSIVGVTVAVGERLMNVLVSVPFGQVKPDAECHETPGRNEARCNRLSPDEQGQHCTNEWSGRKICAGAGRTETSESNHEEHKADTVADEPERECSRHLEFFGQRARQQKADCQVYASGHTTLQCRDLDWIAAGDLLGEVVIYRPAEARPGDGQSAGQTTPFELPLVAQQCTAGDDYHHSQSDSLADILSKDNPGEQGGEYAFQIEEQGRGRGWGVRKSDQQEERSENPAEADRAEEPGDVARGEPCLCCYPGTPPKPPEYAESESRAEIQQARQHLR